MGLAVVCSVWLYVHFGYPPETRNNGLILLCKEQRKNTDSIFNLSHIFPIYLPLKLHIHKKKRVWNAIDPNAARGLTWKNEGWFLLVSPSVLWLEFIIDRLSVFLTKAKLKGACKKAAAKNLALFFIYLLLYLHIHPPQTTDSDLCCGPSISASSPWQETFQYYDSLSGVCGWEVLLVMLVHSWALNMLRQCMW